MPVFNLLGEYRTAVVVISFLVLLFIFTRIRREARFVDVMTGGHVTRQVPRAKSPHTPTKAEDVDLARMQQGLESADMRQNEANSHQTFGRFIPLEADPSAQRLLGSMRRDSERIRRKRAEQTPIVVPASSHSGSEARRLRNEVEDLRRENEMFRYLQSQAIFATASTPSDAPPPYTPRNEPPRT